MNYYLLQITAHVYVAGCENQLNYAVKEMRLVKANDLFDAEEALERIIRSKHDKPPDKKVMRIEIENLTIIAPVV